MNTPPPKGKQELFVSVVVPVRNAGAYVEQFIQQTSEVLSQRFRDFEIVIVDNNSRDDTVARIEACQRNIKNVQLYCLVSRVDDESVYIVGLEQAIGDVVITMDIRVDPPALIPEFLAAYDNGAQIVYGQFQNEKLPLGKQLQRQVVHAASWWPRQRFGLPIDVSTYRLMSRRVINAFLSNSDRYSLFTVIAGFTGFRHAVVSYKPVNISGETISRSMGGEVLRSMRIMLLASKWPLRLLILMALAGAVINLFYSGYVVVVALFVDGLAEGWTSLSLQMALMFFIMFVILGILSDYVLRLVVHNQQRPHYLIARERSSLVLSRKQELNVTQATGFGARTIEESTHDGRHP